MTDEPSRTDSRPGLLRRLLRLARRILLVVLVILVITRITMGLWLPPVARSAAKGAGVHVEWADLDLSLLGLSIDVTGLRVVPLRGDDGAERTGDELAAAQPLARLDDLGLDVDASALLTGTLRVHRVEASGLDLWLSRDGEGVWNVQRLTPPAEDDEQAPEVADDDEQTAEASPPGEPGPVDFTSPAEVGSVTLAGLRVHLDDRFVEPALDTTLEANLFLRDVGHEVRAAELGVELRAAGLLDVATVRGEVDARGSELDADLGVDVAGIDLDALAPYLAPMGIAPVAHRLGTGLSLRAELGAADGQPVAGTLRLADVEVRADGEVELAAPDVEVTITSLATSAVHVAEIAMTGGSAGAERLADGTLRAVGFDLVGAPPDAESADEEEGGSDEADGADGGGGLELRVDLVRLDGFALRFRDGAVQPAAVLEAVLGARAAGLDVGPAPRPLEATLSAGLAGVGDLTLAAVVTRPAAGADEPLRVEATVEAERLTLGAVEPYLTAAGLRTTFGPEGGSLSLGLDATVAPLDGGGQRIDATLEGLALKNAAGDELAGIGSLALVDARSGAGDGATTVESLTMTGLALPVEVLPSGAFRGPGVASHGAEDGAFEEGARRLGLGDASLELTDVRVDDGGLAGVLSASVELLGIADELRLRVEAESDASGPIGRTQVDGDLDLVGLRYDGLADVLRDAGIEPVMERGALRLGFFARLIEEPDKAPEASVTLRDLAAESDGETWLSMEEASVAVALADGATLVETLVVQGPTVRATRTEDGHLRVAGLLIGAAAPPVAEDAAGVDDPMAKERTASAEPAAAAPADEEDAAPADAGPAAVLELVSASLTGATLDWTDLAVEPAVRTAIRVDITAGEVVVEDGLPASFDANLNARVEGALDELTLRARGGGFPAGDGRVSLGVAGSGLRAGPLASYLPPTIEPLLEDGRLTLDLEARVERLDEGGHAVEASVENLALRDGPDGSPLLTMSATRLGASRLDPDAGVFALGEVVGAGLALDVRRTGPDRIEALGFAVVSPPAGADAGDAPLPAEPGDPGPEEAAAPAAGPGAIADPPSVTLERLALGPVRVRYVDATRVDAVPLELELALGTRGPEVLLAPDPEEVGDIELELRGAVQPLVGEVLAELTLEPFAARPQMAARFGLSGIDGARLADVAPDLAQTLDLGLYRDGSVTLAMDAALDVNRRGPMDLGLGRSFGAQAMVGPLEIRPDPSAEPTGFRRLDLELARFDPGTGDARIANVDLEGIRARVTKDADGTVVAGVRLVTPAPVAEAEADVEIVPAEEGAGPEAPAEAAPPEGPEISIARATVSGLDFVYLDETVEPRFELPIDDLSFELQRFSTRTLTENRPFSFRLLVDAGEVELPERSGADNLLFGVLGSVAGAATLQGDSYETERRPVWDLLEVDGRLSLGPRPTGRIQTTLFGLELPTFRGLASASGVEIGDGLVDHKSKVRLRQDGGVSVDTKTTSTYLSLSEPPDGPISKYLSLPAPLDTVLFLLRNEDGAQELPVRLDVGPEGASAASIAAQAAETLGLLITDAVSAAPLRVLGPLGSVAGALGLTPTELTPETVTLEFAPGAATVDAARSTASGGDLAQLAEALRRNVEQRAVVQGTIGRGDIEVARRIGNPPEELLRGLIEAKRRRKGALEEERARAAASARALLAVGENERAAERLDEVRALDGERARIEAALDELFERVRPGAERRAEARTRSAALALARERQERVRLRLIELAGPAAADRIDVRRPRYAAPKDGEDDGIPETGAVTITPK